MNEPKNPILALQVADDESGLLKALGVGQGGRAVVARLVEDPPSAEPRFEARPLASPVADPRDDRVALLADTALVVLIAEAQTDPFSEVVELAEAARIAGCCTLALIADAGVGPDVPADLSERLHRLAASSAALLFQPRRAGAELPDRDATTARDDFALTARRTLQALARLLYHPGVINIDGSELRAVLQEGWAVLGAAEAVGPERVRKGVDAALASLGFQGIALTQATGLLVVVTVGFDVDPDDLEGTLESLRGAASVPPRVAIGAPIEPEWSGRCEVVLLATGVDPRLVLP